MVNVILFSITLTQTHIYSNVCAFFFFLHTESALRRILGSSHVCVARKMFYKLSNVSVLVWSLSGKYEGLPQVVI